MASVSTGGQTASSISVAGRIVSCTDLDIRHGKTEDPTKGFSKKTRSTDSEFMSGILTTSTRAAGPMESSTATGASS